MATYYVDPVSGNNANAGTSVGAAKQTIAGAVAVAIGGDDVLLMATGAHSVAAQVSLAASIRFLGANGSGVVDGTMATVAATASITAMFSLGASANGGFSYLTLDGASLATYCINITDTAVSNLLFACEIHSASSDGIRTNSTNVLSLIGTTLRDNGGSGIAGATGSRAQTQALSCIAHGNGSHGIFGDRGDVRIMNCIAYGNGGDGIRIGDSATSVIVARCTSYDNVGDGVDLGNNTITACYDNTSSSNGSYGFENNAASNTTSAFDFNHTDGNTSGPYSLGTLPGNDNITGDPLFTNAAGGDFSPSSSSPLIGAGLNGRTIGAIEPAAGGGSSVFPVIGSQFIKGLCA